MSLLMRNATVSTRYGGGFVQSIDGSAGGRSGGQPVDWFYYVNGVEAPKGAAATNVHPGDHIWWDLHDWSQTDDVPAVVGSFPEPFLNGIDGKRLPVRVECAAVSGDACRTVSSRLRALGVPAALAAIGTGRRAATRCACSSGRGRTSRGDPARAADRARARARAASTRASAERAATLDAARRTGRRRAHARRRRGARRRHALRRRGARVGRHRHRRRRRRTARRARSTRRRSHNRFAVALAPGGVALPAPAPIVDGRLTPMLARSRSLFYRRLASPLHATRAGVGAVWALALTAAALLLYHPLVLLALTLARARRGVRRRRRAAQLARALRTATIVGAADRRRSTCSSRARA